MSNDWTVVGLDSYTNYYDVNLKKDRNEILKTNKKFYHYIGSLEHIDLLEKIFKEHNPNIVIHLAAQAGVRYSIDNPGSYVITNLLGTFNILELIRKYNPDHFLMASTSSIYGNNKKMPFDENQKTDTPLSFYASTKKSNEVMAHSYSHLFQIPTTVLRFFTVYGPWGRPDMALFKFTKNILSMQPIDIYNYGQMKRDYTYIEDLIKAISLLIDVVPPNPGARKNKFKYDSISQTAPYRIVNIGNEHPVKLMDYISELENILGRVSKKNFLKIQDGDVENTWSDNKLLKKLTGFSPTTNLNEGLHAFVKWYRNYYAD